MRGGEGAMGKRSGQEEVKADYSLRITALY